MKTPQVKPDWPTTTAGMGDSRGEQPCGECQGCGEEPPDNFAGTPWDNIEEWEAEAIKRCREKG